MMVAACTMATISGCGASEVISQPAPVFCSQVPSQPMTLAIHRWRKVPLRSGTRAAGRRIRCAGPLAGSGTITRMRMIGPPISGLPVMPHSLRRIRPVATIVPAERV